MLVNYSTPSIQMFENNINKAVANVLGSCRPNIWEETGNMSDETLNVVNLFYLVVCNGK